MKNNKKVTSRKILIGGIVLFSISIGVELLKAEQKRQAATEIINSAETGLSLSAHFVPQNLIFGATAFSKKTIDEFLDSDAKEISIGERTIDRKFARHVQESYKIDDFNSTYFLVTSLLDIRGVILSAVLIFIFSIAYIVRTEIKEKRNIN